jgi:hypothetical protein
MISVSDHAAAARFAFDNRPKPNIDTGGEFVAELAERFLDDGNATSEIGSLP